MAAAPEDRMKRRQELESQLAEAKKFNIERVGAKCKAEMEFALLEKPIRTNDNNAFAQNMYQIRLEEYNREEMELQRKIESAEQATGFVRELERQIEALSTGVDQTLNNENDNHPGPIIKEVSSSSGSDDEQQSSENSEHEEENDDNQIVPLEWDLERRNPRILAISGPVIHGEVTLRPVYAMMPVENEPQLQEVVVPNMDENDLSLVPYVPPPEILDEQPAVEPAEELALEAPEAQQPHREMAEGIFRNQQIDKHRWSTYADYWGDLYTMMWKNEAEDYLIAQCREATLDYQRFEGEHQFARLEEVIAQKLFGVNEQLADRAIKVNNFLMSYDRAKRIIVRNIRRKIEKIGGPRNLEMQAVPFVIRNDQEIRKKVMGSQMGCVFRVKCKDNPRHFKFVDGEARTYDSWDDFLTTNTLPKAMMCYLSDGFLRRQQAPNPLREVPVKFCETPACSLASRGGKTLSVVINWLSPFATVGLFWTPVGWIGIGLTVATTFVMSYSIIGQAYKIYDKSTHDQSYAMDISHLVSTLGTVVIQKGLPRFLRSVAKAHRDLTKLENTIITAFLWGMSANQVISFVGIVYSFCNKPEITSLDVLNLVVACQNLYCCFISPKSAKRMLEQARGELANEQFRKLTEDQAEEEKLRAEISELERKSELVDKNEAQVIDQQLEKTKQSLERCLADQKLHQSEFQSFKSEHLEKFRRKEIDMKELKEKVNKLKSLQKKLKKGSPEAASLKTEIETKQTEITNGEVEMKALQKQHLQEVQNNMKSEGAKAKYQEFVDDESSNGSSRREIDQNGRIIQVMFEMDAELVFTTAADKQSTIRFANGEKLELVINGELDIHPRSFDQLNHTSTTGTNGNNNETDLQRVFSKTKSFNAGELNKMEYCTQIREIISPYGMISRAEVSAVSDQMKHLEGTSGWKRYFKTSRFDNLPPAEALRLRSTIESLSSSDKTAVFEAGELLAGKLGYTDTHRLAECMKIVDKTINDKIDLFEKQSQDNLNGVDSKNLKDFCCEIFGASDKEISQLQKKNFSTEAVRSMATQQLKQPGKHSDAFAEAVNSKIQEVEKCYFGENSTLPFCHPLSGVCHEMEYGPKTTKIRFNMAEVKKDTADVRNFIKNQIWGENTTNVSQDGMTVSRTWKRTDGYFKQKTTSFSSKDKLLDQSISPGEVSLYGIQLILKGTKKMREQSEIPRPRTSPGSLPSLEE